MSEKPPTAHWTSALDDSCILPYVAAFQRLRTKAEGGDGLTLEEGRMLASLLSMFEHTSFADGRLVRAPVKLELDRKARFRAGGRELEGTVKSATLRYVSVLFARLPPLGASGELEIAGAGPGARWRFDGRVTRLDPTCGKAIIELGAPLGRDAIQWSAA